MKQVLVKKGSAIVMDVPAPAVHDGYVLVEVAYSLISTGTELGNVNRSGSPMLMRAMERPELVRQVINGIKNQGILKTISKVRGKIDSGNPAGYSCSGIVIEVGKGVENIFPGDHVACAGGGLANHAEILSVPSNLITKLPPGCNLRSAASVTLGAIAMQGVRRADLRLGEFAAVIGLGLLGQITVQLLAGQGCRVIGFDLDPKRVDLAKKLGADYSFVSGEVDYLNQINQITDMQGVDATIITAATSSDIPVQQAMEITRKKGRVVVVGDVGLGLKRSPFYDKEIDFLISCSYGPGRYDLLYEMKGLSYPYAYVRWTENRNMVEYLRLLAANKIQVEPILECEYEISKAAKAYEYLRTAINKPLGVLLSYPAGNQQVSKEKLATKITLKKRVLDGKINIAIIGAGNFAKSMHLPNLQQLSNLYHIGAIIDSNGLNAQSTAQQFGADYSGTNYEDVINDPDIDAVVITTPHNLHASQVVAALHAGKHVYCEKPLAMRIEELSDILACYHLSLSSPELQNLVGPALQPILMVGYNRRFSPAAQHVKKVLSKRKNPMMVLYRVNAGFISRDSWIQGPEGGGRIIGEMCHLYDLFSYWVGTSIKSVSIDALTPYSNSLLSSDNLTTTIKYEDGSVCTLFYTALGSTKLNKEYAEVYVDGKTLVLDDYKSLRSFGDSTANWTGSLADKGHKHALELFSHCVKSGEGWPIPIGSLIETSSISISLAGSLYSDPTKQSL